MTDEKKMPFKDWCRNCRWLRNFDWCKACQYKVLREMVVVVPPHFKEEEKKP